MAEERSETAWAEYYRARMAFVREQISPWCMPSMILQAITPCWSLPSNGRSATILKDGERDYGREYSLNLIARPKIWAFPGAA